MIKLLIIIIYITINDTIRCPARVRRSQIRMRIKTKWFVFYKKIYNTYFDYSFLILWLQIRMRLKTKLFVFVSSDVLGEDSGGFVTFVVFTWDNSLRAISNASDTTDETKINNFVFNRIRIYNHRIKCTIEIRIKIWIQNPLSARS